MSSLPSRLHHNAFVVADQERTRHFYEDVLGFPLIATWCEVDPPDGGAEFCHTFFGLGDGSALAFFQFADPELAERNKLPAALPVYFHVALKVDDETQAAISERLDAEGIGAMLLDHGYCRSLYVNDPDGLLVELTADPSNVDEINAVRAASAHEDLARWLGGDRRSNNDWRAAHA